MVSERHLSYSPLMVILWMGEAVILMVFGIPNEQTPLQGSGKLIQWSFCLNRFTWSFKVGFSTNIQLTFISWSIHILVFPLCFSDYLFFRKCFKCFFAGLHFGSWVFAKQETLKVAHSGLNQLQFCFLIIFSIYPMFLSLQVRTLYFLVNFSSQILSFSFSS